MYSQTNRDKSDSEDDFIVIKKPKIDTSQVNSKNNILKFKNGDRFIASRQHLKSVFADHSERKVDILNSESCFESMKFNVYRNLLQNLLSEDDKKENFGFVDSNRKSAISFFKEDWKCKPVKREKFTPDYETMEKRAVGLIHTYSWSSRSMIAAASSSNVCCYDPLKGYTRVINFLDYYILTVCFSNDGKFMVVTVIKNIGEARDVFLYQVDVPEIIDRGVCTNNAFRSRTTEGITACCFTKDDQTLIFGLMNGDIMIYDRKRTFDFEFNRMLPKKHRAEIISIKFSCNYNYMASMDDNGHVTIWNGGSLTSCVGLNGGKRCKLCEWHPFEESQLLLANVKPPALFLFNVASKSIEASYRNVDRSIEVSSLTFNKSTGELVVSFYYKDTQINKIVVLASMDHVIDTYETEDKFGGMWLFWNHSGTMLAGGGFFFRFSFWTSFLPKYYIKNQTLPFEQVGFTAEMMSTNKSTNYSDVLALKSSKMSMQIR